MIISDFNTEEKVLVIAEIGNNHEGDFGLACEMIAAAADAGANAVKFQTIIPDRLVSITNETRIQQLTRFQFSESKFYKLADVAKKHAIMFLSTPFDLSTVDLLNPILPAFKVSSGDNDFWPLLDKIAQTGKPIILSLGLGASTRATQLVRYFEDKWSYYNLKKNDLGLLHCVASYPTPIHEASLSTIHSLKVHGATPGYSDHTIGIRASLFAVACGARIIEKHFTIDKNYSDFHDHQISADPKDLKCLVKELSEMQLMLGAKNASLQDCEKINENKLRRSISAVRNLRKSQVVKETDICWLRPRDGFKPGEEHKVVGERLSKGIQKGEAFNNSHFK